MTKKKKPTIQKVEPVVEQPIDPTPPEDVPTVQLDEAPAEEKKEPEPVAETAPTVEPVAETKPQPVVEPAPVVFEYKIESIHTLPPKPKTLTLAYLQEEFETLMEIIELHSTLITELQETQARKRKPPT